MIPRPMKKNSTASATNAASVTKAGVACPRAFSIMNCATPSPTITTMPVSA